MACHILAAFLRAARRGRKLVASEKLVSERHFNASIHVVWVVIGPLTVPLELRPVDDTLTLRLAFRCFVALVSTLHLLVWRANRPRLQLETHAWVLAAYAVIMVVSQLVLYGALGSIHQV